MKKLAELKLGAHFMYGGVEWVKFEDIGAGTLCLSAGVLFCQAFDEENCNDWRKSSLRRELNGAFLDALVAEGADRGAFLDWESDLTADDGMTDYGTATDKIALRSDALCRKYREITPPVDACCWNLTPWTCDHEYPCSVRRVSSSGTLNNNYAYYGNGGVRPLCYLKSEISVPILGENDEEEQAARREEMKLEAARLMGYEVIENNIPAPECGSREISHLITGDELLRQTAEEAVELAQAALKVIRAAKGTTPLDGEDAVDMLVEEIADVQNCIAVLSERLPGLQDKANKISAEKMKRWKERLR